MKHTQDSKFEEAFLPMTSIGSGMGLAIMPDIYTYTNQIVNLCLVGNIDHPNDFVFVDAGMPKSANELIEVAESRFGANCRPKAIILTHGHFDHVGSLVDLVEHWDIHVYAHELEIPYLTGKVDYPKGDSTVDGGLVSEMSPLFPNHGIDLGNRVVALPNDGSIPEMPDWKWVHTPGHTPGHVSLFREYDRSLIAGDAFVTVKQESLYKVMVQKQEISGPPEYYTTDWQAAYESVVKLTSLKPDIAVTGHGLPMKGEELAEALQYLVENFDKIAKPEKGRYVN